MELSDSEHRQLYLTGLAPPTVPSNLPEEPLSTSLPQQTLTGEAVTIPTHAGITDRVIRRVLRGYGKSKNPLRHPSIPRITPPLAMRYVLLFAPSGSPEYPRVPFFTNKRQCETNAINRSPDERVRSFSVA